MMLTMRKETNGVHVTSCCVIMNILWIWIRSVKSKLLLDFIPFVLQVWLPCFVASTTSSKITSPTTTRTKLRTPQSAAPQSTHRGGYCAATSKISPDSPCAITQLLKPQDRWAAENTTGHLWTLLKGLFKNARPSYIFCSVADEWLLVLASACFRQ